MGLLQSAADGFAAALKARDQDAASRLIAAYAQIRQRLGVMHEQAIADILAAQRRGIPIDAYLQLRHTRAMQLLEQADSEMLDWAALASDITTTEQREAVAAAQSNQERLARIGLGTPTQGITAAFNTLPTEALAELIGVLGDGSPLSAVLDSYGRAAGAEIRRLLVSGMAEGLGPREIARQMRGAMDGNAVRALTVARTETMRAYRDSSLRWMAANDDVITDWIWWSALDERTCPVCWAMHGTRHKLTERMGSHPNCRCTMLPATKTWAELGIKGVPGDNALDVDDGETLFSRLPKSSQEQILGPGKYQAYKSGAMKLADVVKRTDDPRWGITRTESRLADAVAKRQAVPVLPPMTSKEARAWAEKQFATWGKSLTKPEYEALRTYKSSGYRSINPELRDGKITRKHRREVELLDQALARGVIDRDVTAWRAFDNPTLLQHFDRLPGTIISDRAYVSTSIDRAVGERFAGYVRDDGKIPILAEIRVPAGSRGAYIETLLPLQEYELLLARGQSFRVISAEIDSSGQRHIVMEVIDDAKSK